MRFFLLFHAFNELESEILGSIIHCIEEARNMRLSFNFLERRPGEEGLADLNAILARYETKRIFRVNSFFCFFLDSSS